jgi:hypothetical protein
MGIPLHSQRMLEGMGMPGNITGKSPHLRLLIRKLLILHFGRQVKWTGFVDRRQKGKGIPHALVFEKPRRNA